MVVKSIDLFAKYLYIMYLCNQNISFAQLAVLKGKSGQIWFFLWIADIVLENKSFFYCRWNFSSFRYKNLWACSPQGTIRVPVPSWTVQQRVNFCHIQCKILLTTSAIYLRPKPISSLSISLLAHSNLMRLVSYSEKAILWLVCPILFKVCWILCPLLIKGLQHEIFELCFFSQINSTYSSEQYPKIFS